MATFKCPKCGLRYVGGTSSKQCWLDGAWTVKTEPVALEPVTTICTHTNCNKPAVNRVRKLGHWEHVCQDHDNGEWSEQDSITHMVDSLMVGCYAT